MVKTRRRITNPKLVPFLREFSEKHRGQPVTLEVLEGATWKIEESGLPLVGLDVDTRAAAAPALEIILGDEASGDKRHLSHTVSRVRGITVELNRNHEEERLVIEGGDGSQVVVSLD